MECTHSISYDKMGRGESVTIDTIVRICFTLDRDIVNIVKKEV